MSYPISHLISETSHDRTSLSSTFKCFKSEYMKKDEPKEAVGLSKEPPGQGLVEKEQAASDQGPVDELEELNTNMASSDFDHNEDESVDPLKRPILGKENLRDMFGKLLLDLAKNVSSDTMTAFL